MSAQQWSALTMQASAMEKIHGDDPPARLRRPKSNLWRWSRRQHGEHPAQNAFAQPHRRVGFLIPVNMSNAEQPKLSRNFSTPRR
jgi:hypothetical protein